MPPAKKDATTDTETKTTTKPKTQTKSEPNKTFAAEGVTLAGDVRTFAEDLREQLLDLDSRVGDVLADAEPQDGDEQVSAGCRRIVTAVNGLRGHVDALVAAAAQLERDSVR
jgi:hypothetical protein